MKGPLVIIGGHEDKDGDKAILARVASQVRGGKLVIATVASHQPGGYFEAYQKAFGQLGVTDLAELYLNERSEAAQPEALDVLADAAGVFFSGGDQLRITSQIGDTKIERLIWELHERGGLIAGTSAGAAVMSETMLVKGPSAESHRVGDLHMAPGLGLMKDAIIDQHFAERGRIGRLLGAVAQNPRVLGIGIDEDTAIDVGAEQFEVLGAGAVYIVDGAAVSHSNIAEAEPDRTLSLFGVTMHVLSSGDRFSIAERRPIIAESGE